MSGIFRNIFGKQNTGTQDSGKQDSGKLEPKQPNRFETFLGAMLKMNSELGDKEEMVWGMLLDVTNRDVLAANGIRDARSAAVELFAFLDSWNGIATLLGTKPTHMYLPSAGGVTVEGLLGTFDGTQPCLMVVAVKGESIKLGLLHMFLQHQIDNLAIGKMPESVKQAMDANLKDWRRITELDQRAKSRDPSDTAGIIADLTELISLQPDNFEAYLNRGIAKYNKRDIDGAIADYTQSIRLEPNFYYFYYQRGRAYGRKDNWTQAIADYTQSLRLKPDDYDSLLQRGVARMVTGDNTGAMADFTAALRLKPNSGEAYVQRGLVFNKLGDQRQAMADFDQALRVDSKESGAYFGRAMVYDQQSNRRAAVAEYKLFLQVSAREDELTAQARAYVSKYGR